MASQAELNEKANSARKAKAARNKAHKRGKERSPAKWVAAAESKAATERAKEEAMAGQLDGSADGFTLNDQIAEQATTWSKLQQNLLCEQRKLKKKAILLPETEKLLNRERSAGAG